MVVLKVSFKKMSNVHATHEIIVLPASPVSPQIPDTSPHPAPGLTTGLPGSDAASDDGPPKGDTCLASASASSVSPERRVAWEPLARQMPDIEEAIAQQASLILPHIPDPFSDAALNDGPPKADTFFVSAREHVSSSLRTNAPILIVRRTHLNPTRKKSNAPCTERNQKNGHQQTTERHRQTPTPPSSHL